MIVLHGCWHDGALHLWGETSHGPAHTKSTATTYARAHPFAADARELRVATERIGVPKKAARAEPLTIHLPSHPRGPRPSPQAERVREPHPEAEAGGAASWIVPAVAVNGAAAADLLLQLPGEPVEGIIIADTLRWFGEGAKLALEMVAGGRVHPSLDRVPAGWRASWRPVLADDGDAARFAALRRAIPGACTAGEHDWMEGDDPPALILAALVDATVRSALGGESAIPGGAKKTPGEVWARNLAWRDGTFREQTGIAAAHDALARWMRPLDRARPGGLRTCFQLSAPGESAESAAAGDGAGRPSAGGNGAEGAWRLEFLLQAADDPSLLVPAEKVWKARGPLRVLRRTLDNPQERLLGDLGRALRLFPPLEPGLRGKRPAGCDLDAEGAYRFLREGAPLLAQAGFGVRVPAWWGRAGARLGARLRARPRKQQKNDAAGRFGLETLVAYDWKVSIGDQALTEAELRALATAKVPLVRFRGEWVEIRPDEVQAALRLFENGGRGEMTAAELLRLAAGAETAEVELPVAEVEAEGWLAELLDAAGTARVEPVAPPPGFAGTLRPYQERGVSWLAFLDRLGFGACLADDMGLGKTVQLLALLLAARAADGDGAPPTLLVCPMSLVGNWQREAARFAPQLRVHVHHGGERLTGDALVSAVAESDLVITTYALAARDREELSAVQWGRVVLDEAQNIKNAGARQSQAVRALHAPRRIALTGTPVENRLSELWSILDFLNPGFLGSAKAFRERFAVPVERFRDANAAAGLQRLVRPFVLRRVKTDRSIIQDLPAKQEMTVYCNLTREQASLYQATVDEMMERIENSEGIERRGLVLSTLMKLKQACNHPAQLLGDRSALAGRSGKLARLEEVLDEVIELGDRALVFTQYAEMGLLLRERLQERLARELPFLHGGTRRAEREAMVARFQSGDGPPVLLLSLKAGGTGLNLTAANHVIHYDRWWNPAVEDQATDRAFRIGQRKNVQVRKLVCVGTVEERIDAVIAEKKELAASVLGTGEGWITELSTDDLRRVITLGADAVAE